MQSKVAVLIPRMDLPFKKISGFREGESKLPENIIEVRSHWSNFFSILRMALDELGLEYSVYEIPMWEITQDFVRELDEKIVVLPHKTSRQINDPSKIILYSMQIMTRWLFSLDVSGWGASSSMYPCHMFWEGSADPGTYERYVELLVNKSSSKFKQPKKRGRIRLLLRREIPLRKFLFFPCQIPHDESLRFHSNVTEVDVIKRLVEWADINKQYVVFKKHPANLKAMKEFDEIIDSSRYSLWSDANIHELISLSEGVLTINSGTGFEALLHKKPVVTFGNTEYDVLTYKSNLKDLDDAYRFIRSFRFDDFKEKYYRFFNWYCEIYCLDTTLDKSKQIEQVKNILLKCSGGIKLGVR